MQRRHAKLSKEKENISEHIYSLPPGFNGKMVESNTGAKGSKVMLNQCPKTREIDLIKHHI